MSHSPANCSIPVYNGNQKITITENILINHSLLTQHVLDDVKNAVKAQYTDLCDEKYGYIQKVHDDIQIHNNIITKNETIYFVVTFSVTCVIPVKGKELEVTIMVVTPDGVIVDIFPPIRIMILKDSLSGFTYTSKQEYKKGSFVLKEGKKIIVKIQQIKYENNKFTGIGTLV